MRLLACGKSFQPPSIHKEEIGPAVMVIVVKGKAAPGCFQQILIVELSSVDGLAGQSGLRGHLDETDAERRSFNR